MLTLREPARGRFDAEQLGTRMTLRDALLFIADSPPLLHVLAGTFVLSFAGWGLVCALIVFVSNIANLVVAPILIGFMSDTIAPHLASPVDSLRMILAAMSLTGFWAAWRYWAAAAAGKSPHD